MEILTLQGVK